MFHRPTQTVFVAAALLVSPAAVAQPDVTVVAIGASNTSGFGVGEAAAYPARLEEILRGCGFAVRVVNAGISFETTNGMLARIDRDVPDGTRAVVIQPGGNDRRFFVSRKQRAENIAQMTARLAARSIPAIVYDPVFPPEAYQWDGIHLTAARHLLVAQELAPSVAAKLGKSPSGGRKSVLPGRLRTSRAGVSADNWCSLRLPVRGSPGNRGRSRRFVCPTPPSASGTSTMRVRAGFDLAFETSGPTPMNLLLNIRPERRDDLETCETIVFDPPVPATQHVDGFGNVMTRIVAPGGRIAISADFVIHDCGLPDDLAPEAREIPVQDLPDDVLPFLLGSRYCDTDKLSQTAWNTFGCLSPGWGRVQAIVDYAHRRLRFDYQQADATRSAHDGHGQQVGVCRDFAHLAITLCRCMNIPARYATGYLGDIGVPKDPAPMDFSAWFEVFLEGPEGPRWYTFDARHNTPRIARIVMARGRDATDCALTTSFGSAILLQFEVHTDELPEEAEEVSLPIAA